MVDQPEKKQEREPQKEPSAKNKLDESLEKLKKNETIEDLYAYAKSNTLDTVAYIAMIVGILTLFFEPFYGGILVGIVSGIYFAQEFIYPIRNVEELIEQLGMVRSIIFGGLALALFVSVPWIFIGAAIGTAIKLIIKMK